MPCELVYVHRPGPPQSTTMKCDGKCDPVYKKEIVGKTERYVAVQPECKFVTPVTWKAKQKNFEPTRPYCYCTVPPLGDPPCKCTVTVEQNEPTKITDAKCEGECGTYYTDPQGRTKASTRCVLAMNDAKQIECVCVVG